MDTATRYLDLLLTLFGPDLVQLLEDANVIEVMLNPDGQVFVDRLFKGKEKTDLFILAERAESIVKLVASYKDAVANTEHPFIATDIPLKGARFQGWLPPVVSAPCFAIRKRATHIFTLSDYLKEGSLSSKAKSYLEKAVESRENIVIVGGTSSGKTTFANALLALLKHSDHRMLVLEDLPELQIDASDVVILNTTPTVSMRDLVMGSLRMRPDRLIIGEVRDGAALELLKAWNTGHPGGICTLHANSVESALYRLEDLIQEVVTTVPRNLILEAVHVLVFLERNSQGQRCIKKIARLKSHENGRYQLEFPCEN